MTTVNRDAVLGVLADNPDLSANGWNFQGGPSQPEMTRAEFADYRNRLTTHVGLEQISTACQYLQRFGPSPRYWSYGLKHDIEYWGQEVGLSGYVSNGAAIVAAILCGYPIKRERNSPNCTIGDRIRTTKKALKTR